MRKLTIGEIEALLFAGQGVDESFISMLEKDRRKGVRLLLEKWKRKEEYARLAAEKFLEMKCYEEVCRSQGYRYIAGIDEAGRGPLAGPVAAAAVILPEDFYLAGLDDSKKLSKQKREEYFHIIRSQALSVSVALVDAEEIDRINVYEAARKAMATAVANLDFRPEFLLVDAVKLDTPISQEAIIQGDAKSISIAAASIIAKVTRDRLMEKAHREHPAYGFATNMGYGTREHLQAIHTYGVTPYHRKSFAPVKKFFENR